LSNIHDADHRWRNMCEMLDRLGLDASMLAHGRLATDLRFAVSTCQSCSADQACQEWLVRAPEAIAWDILERQIETAAPLAIALPALHERAIADAAPELF